MADLSDVINALGQLASAALYPGQNPPAGKSPLAGVNVLVQDGWPDPNTLRDQLARGWAQVSVYPTPMERNVTRYPREWLQTEGLQAKTFTLAQAGQQVTVGGVQPAVFYGQNLAVFVNGKPYIYRTVQTDTPSTIAAALQALIAADLGGTSVAGPTIALPAIARVGALRVGTQAAVAMEVKRQERYFLLIIWAPDTATRDKVAAPIDVAVGLAQWMTLADGSRARLIYKGSPFTDFDQKQGVYRRDISVAVEYATKATDTATEVIAAKTIASQQGADGSTITPPIATQYN